MTTLTCMRGLPGSGKTTHAKSRLGTPYEVIRTSRDDIRKDMFDAEGVLPWASEQIITQFQQSMVVTALQAGLDVIVDDMNLRPKYLREWDRIAQENGADFRTWEIYTPLDECVARDLIRFEDGGRGVGEETIRHIAAKFMPKGQFLPHTWYVPKAVSQGEFEPYRNPRHLPQVVLVDIDGTVALMGDRDPYDWKTVSQDSPNWPVVGMVQSLLAVGSRVIFLSGRDGSCRYDTSRWLHRYFPGQPWSLFMREAGDSRKDSIVKNEIFNREIRDRYHVKFVLDDRDQVVKMWRSIGLPVFQVAEGAF